MRTSESAAPSVSVIVHATPASRDLAGTLASIRDQTFSDVEVIVAGEGRNPGRARNAAIAAARGRYLAFLEADDRWVADFLERRMWYLDAHPWSHLVYGDANLCGDTPAAGRRFSDVLPSNGVVTLVSLLDQRCTIPRSTIVVRHDAVLDAGLFDDALEYRQDYDLWLRLVHRGWQVAHQRDVLTDCWIVRRDPLAELQRTFDVLERFGRSHVLHAEERRALRARSLRLLDQIDVELAKRRFLEGNFSAAAFHLSASRQRTLAWLVSLLTRPAAPRVAGRLAVALSGQATQRLHYFRRRDVLCNLEVA